jgi:hypothetical protein
MTIGPQFSTPLGSAVGPPNTALPASLRDFECWIDEQLRQLEDRYRDFQTQHSIARHLCGDAARKAPRTARQ